MFFIVFTTMGSRTGLTHRLERTFSSYDDADEYLVDVLGGEFPDLEIRNVSQMPLKMLEVLDEKGFKLLVDSNRPIVFIK